MRCCIVFLEHPVALVSCHIMSPFKHLKHCILTDGLFIENKFAANELTKFKENKKACSWSHCRPALPSLVLEMLGSPMARFPNCARRLQSHSHWWTLTWIIHDMTLNIYLINLWKLRPVLLFRCINYAAIQWTIYLDEFSATFYRNVFMTNHGWQQMSQIDVWWVLILVNKLPNCCHLFWGWALWKSS